MRFIKKSFHFLLTLGVLICSIQMILPPSVFADTSIPAIPTHNTAPSALQFPSDASLAKSAPINLIHPNSVPTSPAKTNEKTMSALVATMQYNQPSVTLTSTTATSLTVNVVFPGSGLYGNGLYVYDYATSQWTDVSKTWYTTNGSYIINNLKPATTYFVEEIWYTDATNAWLQRYSGVNFTTAPAVAELTIYADGNILGSSFLNFGHAFISVKNISSGNINVGGFSGIAPSKTMSIGTWGNTTEDTGLWYDLEEWYAFNRQAFTSAASLTTQLSSSQLSSVNAYIINNDYWSNTTNCSSFASSLWNSVASTKVSAGIPNLPLSLKNSITSQAGYTIGKVIPWDYVVYFAQGTGVPKQSTVYK